MSKRIAYLASNRKVLFTFKVCLVLILILTIFVTCPSLYKKFSMSTPPAASPTLLMVFNGEYAYEAENAFASLKQNVNELIPNLSICVSDEASLSFANTHNLRFFELSKIEGTGNYLSRSMNIMTRRKMECILHLLENDQDVLYFDTDLVFLQNPLSELNTKYDINMQSDECIRPYKHVNLCTGFMYIKSNPKTINFMNQVIDEIVNADYRITDQHAFVELVQAKSLRKWYNFAGVSINVLDVCKFPNGCRYFEGSDKICRQEQALIVHNNHILGLQNKHQRFKEHGLLFNN